MSVLEHSSYPWVMGPRIQYITSPFPIACVKDLIRSLRGDDGRCEIRRQLGYAGILQKVGREERGVCVVTASSHSRTCYQFSLNRLMMQCFEMMSSGKRYQGNHNQMANIPPP